MGLAEKGFVLVGGGDDSVVADEYWYCIVTLWNFRVKRVSVCASEGKFAPIILARVFLGDPRVDFGVKWVYGTTEVLGKL